MKSMTLACAAAFLMSMGSGAWAQTRPLTLRMSCDRAQGLVAAQGAAVLSTGPLTYDRYVAAGNQCLLGEVAEPAWAPTADTPQCPLGYRCVARTRPSR